MRLYNIIILHNLKINRAPDRSGKKVKFPKMFRNKFGEKMAYFVGNSRTFSGQISLRNDQSETTNFVEIFWANFAIGFAMI